MDTFIVPGEIREDRVFSKYYRIYSQLKKELFFGKYVPGERFFSIRDLREKYAVNIQTIRTAVDLLVEDGFLLNQPARGLYVNVPEKRKPDIAMGNVWFCQMGREKNHPYDNGVLTEIQALAAGKGLNVIVNRNADADGFVRWFRPETGDGLVVTGELDKAFIDRLRSLKIPRYIVVGNYELPDDVPNVRHKTAETIYKALEMTAAAGRRRLGVIIGPKDRLVTKETLRGIDNAVRDGLIDYIGGVFAFPEDGYAGMLKLRDAGIDSVFVTTPAYFGLCRYVVERKIQCPEELFVIRGGKGEGEDNDAYRDIAALTIPANVRGPAERAMDALFGDGPKRSELEVGIVVPSLNFQRLNMEIVAR